MGASLPFLRRRGLPQRAEIGIQAFRLRFEARILIHDGFLEAGDEVLDLEGLLAGHLAFPQFPDQVLQSLAAFVQQSPQAPDALLLEFGFLLPQPQFAQVDPPAVFPQQDFFLAPRFGLVLEFTVLGLQPDDEGRNVGALLVKVAARAVHDGEVQSVPGGDIQGAAFAGYAHQDTVGRRKRRGVEVHRRVDDAFLGVAVVFENSMMGGRQQARADRDEMVQKGHRDRAALLGVGARSQFVQQDQGSIGRGGDDGGNIGHVGREGRQRLAYRLLVPDVRVDAVEDGQRRAFFGGQGQSELVHEGEKADGLQRHRLAAGVRTGDYHDARGRVHRYVDGHRFGSEHGMARLAQLELAGSRIRECSARFEGIARAGAQAVKDYRALR